MRTYSTTPAPGGRFKAFFRRVAAALKSFFCEAAAAYREIAVKTVMVIKNIFIVMARLVRALPATLARAAARFVEIAPELPGRALAAIKRAGRAAVACPGRVWRAILNLPRTFAGIGRMFVDSMGELTKTRNLVKASMLLALDIALSLTVSIMVTPDVRISFGYLAVAANGMLFGPFVAMISNAASDIITYIIRPQGAYIPGFTLNAALSGMVYGIAFYRRRDIKLRHIITARLIVSLFINIVLGTYWLKGAQGMGAVFASLPARIIKNAAQFPVDVALLVPFLGRVRNTFRPEEFSIYNIP